MNAELEFVDLDGKSKGLQMMSWEEGNKGEADLRRLVERVLDGVRVRAELGWSEGATGRSFQILDGKGQAMAFFSPELLDPAPLFGDVCVPVGEVEGAIRGVEMKGWTRYTLGGREMVALHPDLADWRAGGLAPWLCSGLEQPAPWGHTLRVARWMALRRPTSPCRSAPWTTSASIAPKTTRKFARSSSPRTRPGSC